MGNVQTSVGKQVVSDVNNIITNITSSAIANSSNIQVSSNVFKAQLGGERYENGILAQSCGKGPIGPFGTIILNQKNVTTQSLTTEATEKAAVAVKNNIANDIQQYFDSTVGQKNEWLSIALNVNTSVKNSVATTVNDIVSNIDTNTKASCAGFVYNENIVNILFCAPTIGPSANINQTNDVTVAVTCTAKLVFDAITSNTNLNSFIQKAEEKVKQGNEGPGSIFKMIGYFLLVIIVIVIVAAVIMAVFHSKKPPTQRPYYNPYEYQNYYAQNGYSQVQAGVA